MPEGLSRFSHYEQPGTETAEASQEVGAPSPESIEAAEAALRLYEEIEATYGTGEHFGEAARIGAERMRDLSQLISDPEVRSVFDSQLQASRVANGWTPPSERVAV